MVNQIRRQLELGERLWGKRHALSENLLTKKMCVQWCEGQIIEMYTPPKSYVDTKNDGF